MKTLFLVALFSAVSCQAKEKPVETKTTEAKPATPKTEEDCDDKAAAVKKVEIKEDSISLTNPDAGCTLE